MSSNSDEIFLIANDKIQPLQARTFKAGLFGKSLEDALQTLIEKQPNLISGGRQIDPDDPPRFVMLKRETHVGDWSLDHLLVDQRGTPTLVEAKLLQNPEARRAVVGQILDYAACAAENWGEGRLRQSAADYWREQNADVESILRDAFGEIDVEEFWHRVEANLQQGNIRLVIVADQLSPEARRVIEFLNEQMRTVEVFGLEIRCYGTDSNTVVVPYLVGQTQAVATQKAGSAAKAKNWTIDEIRTAYEAMGDTVHSRRLLRLLHWAIQQDSVAPGQDTQNPLFSIIGRSGKWIVGVAPGWIYPRLQESRWANLSERNSFVDDLKKIGLYPEDFDPASTKDGKNTSKLESWTDEQFEAFLSTLAKYCRSSSSAAASH